ncbi:MAG: hypothetical protein IJQ07_05190 [Clostridia bacterium]|nr:hypothetical protein [Clostridia bacterium]
MSEDLKCPICGKPTFLVYGKHPRKDGLCKECSQKLFNKEIIQCPDCGKWHKTDEPCTCKNDTKEIKTNKSEHKCEICGQTTTNKYICNDCYKRVDKSFEEIDKNTTPTKIRDYYYNLKNYIYRTEYTDAELLYNKLSKLYALADLSKKLFGREDLFNKVLYDIKDIKEGKENNKAKTVSEEEKIERDLNTAGINRTKDGHFVKSEYEVTVDDILFDLSEVHIYEKIVAKITERTVVCDWYIPVYKNNGIYIELWGIDKNYKYNINKEEKRELYKKHNLPLIEIEKDELKGDTLGLHDRIESEIIKYKNKIKEDI